MLAAVGCSQDKDTNDSKTSKQSNTGSDESSSDEVETVEFTIWHSFVGADQRAEFMEDRMNAFRELHPEYIIDEQKIPRDQYQTKLKTEAAAGQLPDSFLIWPNAMTKEFAEAGLISDINDYLEANPEWRNSFVNRALDEFTVDGMTYTASLGVSITSIVFYNKAIFEKYGVSYPTSYSELLEVIDVFNDNDIIPIALGNKAKWPAQSTIFSCTANRDTGSEWLDSTLAGTGSKFTDPEFVEALRKMNELAEVGAFNEDYNSIDEVQMRSYFYNGDAAMMIGGSWIVPELINNAPDELKENLELTILPGFEGGNGDPNTMSGVSSTGIAISSDTTPDQKAAIEELIQFLTNEDAQKMYASYNIPVSSKTVSIDESEMDPVYNKMLTLIKEYPMVAVYDSALSSELTDIINNGLQAVMMGAQTPEELAQEMQNALE
jgi:raffinose/stachyose/melibiose transport system substrate-binding protein